MRELFAVVGAGRSDGLMHVRYERWVAVWWCKETL